MSIGIAIGMSDMPIDTFIGISIGMHIDMVTDTSIETSSGMFISALIGIYEDMLIGIPIVMCIDMLTDM